LRGSVVPVIDMRRKFGMPEAESTRDTCIVVVDVEVDGDSVIVGALVDSVREVLDLTPEQIEPPPRMGTQLKTELILGMGSLGDRFVVLLDIDRVFSADELALAQGLAETEKAV
jgi:purine-binding chemotaxis protein CheW